MSAEEGEVAERGAEFNFWAQALVKQCLGTSASVDRLTAHVAVSRRLWLSLSLAF